MQTTNSATWGTKSFSGANDVRIVVPQVKQIVRGRTPSNTIYNGN